MTAGMIASVICVVVVVVVPAYLAADIVRT